MSYKPPYKITPKIITLIEQIGEALGVLALRAEVNDLRLRRIHRIQTIHGRILAEKGTRMYVFRNPFLESSLFKPVRQNNFSGRQD
ncbi:MAG: hypothetical protein KAU94_10005 [Verrucomicrobia bacterium]|nr:hypothetical protein [Verrucomicrobiota bacterium]